MRTKPNRPLAAAAALLLIAAVLLWWPRNQAGSPPKIYPVTPARRPFAVSPPPVRYDVTDFPGGTGPDGRPYLLSPVVLNQRGDVAGNVSEDPFAFLLRRGGEAPVSPNRPACFLRRGRTGQTVLMQMPPGYFGVRLFGLSDEDAPRIFATGQPAANTQTFHRLEWQNGTWHERGTLSGTPVVGNTRGEVVVLPRRDEPFLYRADGKVVRLDRGVPIALNETGRIVGTLDARALIWDPATGRASALRSGEAAEAADTAAMDINERGNVLLHAVSGVRRRRSAVPGAARSPGADGGAERNVYLEWTAKARLVPVLSFTGPASQKVYLNDRGQAAGIGFAAPAAGSSPLPWEHGAYLWQNGRVSDLNDALPAGSAGRLDTVVALNNRGQMLVEGTKNGARFGLLLTPRAWKN